MSGGPYGRGKAPERACMKLENWPEVDRRLWLAALAPADPFEERGGERAGYSTISNAKTVKGYGRWLTWLTVSGHLDEAMAPHARITRPRVESYVQHLRDLGNGGVTILARLQELGEAARVFDPKADWSFINKVASRVRASTVPVRDKRAKLALTDELFALGLSLMAKAADESTPRLAALAYRDGLVIALLALRPMRRRNLAGLALGTTLQRVGGRWLILVPPEETKTGVPIELPWPEVLAPHLEIYLSEHRPRLVAMTHRWTSPVGDALWVSSHGSPMTQMALYDQIRQRTREGLGKDDPHLFRDAAATLLAIADPVHVRLAAPLLGHRTLSTTEAHYQQAQSLSAHRQFTEVVGRRRIRKTR
jgi:integrase